MSDLKPSRKMKSVSTDELVTTEGEAGAEMVVAVLVDGLGDVRASGANLTLFFDGLLVADTSEGEVIFGVVGEVGEVTSLLAMVD